MEDNDDIDFVASEHDRLISAVTKLDKTQHITAPSRSEPTNLHSEFNLIKTDKKLNLKNVAKVLEDTAHHVQVSKKLRKSTDANKVLPKPIEKPQAERIKRSTGYEKTKEKVGRWDPVVARNRTVDYVSFPIKQTNNKMQLTHDFLSKMKLKSPLEKELEKVDPQPAVEESDNEEQTYPMTYQEMLEHRQQIAKVRAQQSYKAAKAKRQSKIKSKKYHRILKKEKLKLQLKEFEELQKTDPEEALKKLEALEKARALERHTLRHKNTGKWAKSKLVRAKYDKEVRQQLSEQLSVSRSLTKKIQDNKSSDDESENEEAIPDMALSQDPMNPWMTQQGDKSNVNAEFDFGYKKYLKDRMHKRKHDSDSDNSDEGNDDTALNALKESIDKLYQDEENKALEKNVVSGSCDNQECNQNNDTASVGNQCKLISKKAKAIKKPLKKIKSKVISTSNWVVEPIDNYNNEKDAAENISSAFETLESQVTSKLDKKLAKIRKTIASLEKPSKLKRQIKQDKEEIDNLEYLKLKKQKITPVIDEELLETNSKSKNVQKVGKFSAKISADNSQANSTGEITSNQISDIDPNRFIEAKPTYLNTALPGGGNEFDNLDDDEQVVPKVNIEEVFEEDDVVASFRQEKEDEINKDKPEDIDLSLPGWGAWGGKGVKAPRRRKNRFIVKPAPEMPRRDENKGDIIIKEVKDPKLAVHKVTELPFPFSSVKDFEASIRAPLGNTFIPEKAHKKLIRPNVITKAGTIIDPMDEDELLVKRNRRFNNESVIKLIGQKNV